MEDLFSIGELSRYQNISRQTLIFYDKIGLFCPAYVDPHNGYRYYSAWDFHMLLRARYYQKCGFSLEEISELFRSRQLSDIGKSLHGAQEDGGDLLPGHIFVKTDAGPGVSAFLCVEKGSVRIFGETDAQTEQMINDGTAAPDHDIDAFPAILVMAGPHGILKVGIVIIVIPEDADAALGQHGIAGGKAALGQKQYFLVGRQVEGSVEPCNAAAGDGRVKV